MAGLPSSLEITAGKKFFQPGHTFYKWKAPLVPNEEAWLTLRLTPANFVDEKKVPLETWEAVDFFSLSGVAPADESVAFKNFRWELEKE